MTKCIICEAENNHMWTINPDKPNLYCGPCELIRKAAAGTTTHLFENVYLGDMIAASNFKGNRLCVHEYGRSYDIDLYDYHFVPILDKRPNSNMDRTGAVASYKKLQMAAEIILQYSYTKEPLIIHCQGGVERSPLTIAYYMVKYRKFNTYQEAYAWLKSIRPVVADRRFWLTGEV